MRNLGNFQQKKACCLKKVRHKTLTACWFEPYRMFHRTFVRSNLFPENTEKLCFPNSNLFQVFTLSKITKLMWKIWQNQTNFRRRWRRNAVSTNTLVGGGFLRSRFWRWIFFFWGGGGMFQYVAFCAAPLWTEEEFFLTPPKHNSKFFEEKNPAFEKRKLLNLGPVPKFRSARKNACPLGKATL